MPLRSIPAGERWTTAAGPNGLDLPAVLSPLPLPEWLELPATAGRPGGAEPGRGGTMAGRPVEVWLAANKVPAVWRMEARSMGHLAGGLALEDISQSTKNRTFPFAGETGVVLGCGSMYSPCQSGKRH